MTDIREIPNPYPTDNSDGRTFLEGWSKEVHVANCLRHYGRFKDVSTPRFQIDRWNSERINFNSPDVIADGYRFEVKTYAHHDDRYKLINERKLRLGFDWLVVVRTDGVLRFIPWDALSYGQCSVWDGDKCGYGDKNWVYFTHDMMRRYGRTLAQFTECELE